MVRHRTKKQIIIAVIFFGFWTGLGSLLVWATREPPPPPTPTPRAVLALQGISASVLRTAEGRADVIGVLRNPNADAGAERVRYQFTLRVGDTTVRTIPGETFILPGQQKYVVAFNEEVPPGDASAELVVEQPSWTTVGEDFRPPSIVRVNHTTRVLPGTPPVFEVKGLLANESDVDYLRVEVTTVGFGANRDIAGIGYTFVGSLLALERREFTAQWPLPPGRDVATVVVLPDVNVFRADAVQKREGSIDVMDVPRGPALSPVPSKRPR